MIAVGSRVRVFWKDENEWFTGNVKDINKEKELIFVVYDDGDEQWEPSSEVSLQGTLFIVKSPSNLIEKPETFSDTAQAFQVEIFENNDEEVPGSNHVLPSELDEDTFPFPLDSRSQIEEHLIDSEIEFGDERKEYGYREEYVSHLESSEISAASSDHESSIPSQNDLPSYVIHAGTLFGCVVSADHLVYKNTAPNAFVRVSLLEKSVNRKMDHILCAKRILWTTPVLLNTQKPHWHTGVVSKDEQDHTRVHLEGEPSCFSLSLQAPLESDLPQWSLLPGTLIFTLFHQIEAFACKSASRMRNEILYQAIVPLTKLVEINQTLSIESNEKTVWHLIEIPLESRQYDTPSAILTTAFHFTPTFIGQTMDHRENVSISLSQGRRKSKLLQESKSKNPSLCMAQRKSKVLSKSAVKRNHKSSSQINRQRLDKKIQNENEKLSQRLALVRSSAQSRKKQSTKSEGSARVKLCQKEEEISHEIVEFQTQLTEWKNRVISIRRQCQKLKMRNEKKTQMRDSLQNAFDTQTFSKQISLQNTIETSKSPHHLLLKQKEQQAQRYVQLQMQKKSLNETVKKLEEKLEFVRRHRIFKERMGKNDNERRYRLKRQQLASSKEEDDHFALYLAQKEYHQLRRKEKLCSTPSNQDCDAEFERVLH
uniref:Uncharacterized protein AlNc14C19G1986 n=1 Tax=Albugo laibachii Nc14 TaxID=890382 RepID=F0W515_9STRA|nr:conserved hypothetical protein [Albugo laibachii Nc14]|eukprot:CCA16206.1 conserved hypothetical protein [Albugo laibachii Nc14]